MINNITLDSFKSFLYRELAFDNLTVLTGLNSSGKSSIIQSILILDKAFKNEKSLLLNGHGTVKDVKNKHSKNHIEFKVEIDKKEYSIPFPRANSTFNSEVFPTLWYISANRFGSELSIPIYNDPILKNRIGRNGENVLQCIRYFELEEVIPLDKNMVHPNTESETLLDNIREWLKVISPNVEFDYSILDVSDTSYATYNGYRATNVGFGLSYILPVITALLASTLSNNNLVIIENPEAHLHPKGQSELAKLICLCAQAGTQVLIESHSDHIFNGVRVFIKENPDFSEKSLFHWLELDEHKNTDITSIIIDKNGRLTNCPKGFFDQFELDYSKLI